MLTVCPKCSSKGLFVSLIQVTKATHLYIHTHY